MYLRIHKKIKQKNAYITFQQVRIKPKNAGKKRFKTFILPPALIIFATCKIK